MNILIIPCTEWLEGSQQRLHHFARKWSKQHKVHVLYIERPKDSGTSEKVRHNIPNQFIHKVPTIRTQSLGSFYISNCGFQFLSILKIILKNKVDVIVAEGLGASSIAIIAAKITCRPVVYDYSDYYPDFIPLYAQKGLMAHFFKIVGHLSNVLNIKASDATVTVSDLLTDHAKLFNKNVIKVSNGVSKVFLGSKDPATFYKQPEETIKLGFVGTLESWVSLERVIDAVHRLNFTEHIETELLVIGNGPKMPFLVDYANRMGIAEKVKFIGWIPYTELHKYIKDLDICVLPFDKSDLSLYSMPMKIHEYSLSKKPTISTPLPEIVSTYGDTVLYAETSEEYTCCVLDLVRHNRKRLSLIDNAYQIAHDNSWEALAKKYEDLLLLK